jgi:hypothetical protein
MRDATKVTKVYTYPELSDSAKEKVREWWNRCQWDDGVGQENMAMIFDEYMSGDGWIDVSGLTYDLYSQGGYPEWKGTRRGWEYGGRVWTIETGVSRWYHGPKGIRVTVEYQTDEDSDPTDEEQKAAEDAADDYVSELSSTLFYAFRDEDEHMASDEYVADACEANSYEFTEDGDLYA